MTNNTSNLFTFQHGGVCGLDISPGPPTRTGEKTRLFLLPQLQDRDHTHVDIDKVCVN